MPSPLAHSIVSISIPLATLSHLRSRLRPKEWVALFLLCLGLGNSPDLDLVPVLFDHSLWDTVHRWLGHNLFAYFLFFLVGIWLMKLFVPTLTLRERRFTSAFLVGSHLFLDSMVSPPVTVTGVPLFWPLTKQVVHFPVAIFPGLSYKKGVHEGLSFFTDAGNWRNVFAPELMMSLTLSVLLILMGRLISHCRYLRDFRYKSQK